MHNKIWAVSQVTKSYLINASINPVELYGNKITHSFFGLMDCNLQSTLLNAIEFTFDMQNITTTRTLLQEERKNLNSCQHEH